MSNATLTSDESFFDEKMTLRQNMTMRIRKILPYLLVGIVVIAGAILWRSSSSATPVLLPLTENQPLPVATLRADYVESYSRDRYYTGLLREARRSMLSFQRGGEVIELLVDEGQSVEEGQTLARLDDRHIRANGARLAAQVDEAKAMLAELLAGPRQETIAAKKAELRAQQSQSQILAKQLARREQLLQTTAVTREEYETFLFDLEAAEARVEVVQRQLDELLAGTRVEQVAAQRARLSQLDAQLTDLAHDLQDTKLVAPFSGRISRRLIDEGAVLSTGSSVVE
ncbi:MAG: biotin/lipoyl-binding protein, partial [Planctomycetes bacterium]|nr:biotin/lipoyl-binding protein [Planctomycetota bacterium]